MNKGVYFPSWSLWMAHKLLFLHHGPDSKHTNHDDSLDFEPGLELAVVTMELPLRSLCGSCNWYKLGNKYIPYVLYELTSSYFFFLIPLVCFCQSFHPNACFQTICRFSAFSSGACGQAPDSLSAEVCPWKIAFATKYKSKSLFCTSRFPLYSGRLGCSYYFVYREILLVSAKAPLPSSLSFLYWWGCMTGCKHRCFILSLQSYCGK